MEISNDKNHSAKLLAVCTVDSVILLFFAELQ